MSTATINAPFICIDTNNIQRPSQNYSIILPSSSYTTSDTTNIIDKYEETIMDLLYKILRNKETYKHSSINTEYIGENMQKYYYTKRSVSYNNITFEFQIDFIYEIYKDLSENLFIAQNEFFNICGYGDTINEAEQDLYNTLYELWKIYAEESDDKLDKKAKEIKQKLLTNIRKLN